MTDIRISKEDEKKIVKAVVLLRKMDTLKSGDGGVIERLVVGQQVKNLPKHIRSQAEARMRGEDRPGLEGAVSKPGDKNAVAAEWKKVLEEHKDLKAKWNQAAVDSELLFQTSLIDFGSNMDPLIKALEEARDSAVPKAKGLADKALTVLVEARRSLQPLSDAASQAVEDLTQFIQLVDYLEGDPPETMAEVRGARARFAEAIQAVRRSEMEIRRQCQAINEMAADSQASLETTIKAMVVAAIAWRQSKGTREGTEWVESLLNGAVGLVQVAAGEPLSAVGVQGLHMLIKGICDGIKGLATLIESWSLKKREVMDLLNDLEADDFIQSKLDLIKIGLSWAAEPLGFIPSVGTIVRSAINAGVGLAIGTLKEAAKRQKEAKNALTKANFTSEIDEIGDTIRESVMNTVKVGLESGAETAKDWGEYVKGSKDPAELVINAVAGILGPPLQNLLADLVPAFKLADKEQIKKSLQGTRDSVQSMANELATMKKIDVDYALDEDAAKEATIKAIAALKEVGQSSQVMVVYSEEIGSRGVALLVGASQGPDNVKFARAMIDGDSGYEGMVTLTKVPSGIFGGTIEFTFPGSDKAAGMVKDYLEHFGTGSSRITKHSVKYG